VRTVSMWAESSHREVSYALCDDRRTLLWFGNQRAVEYHPTLVCAEQWDRPTHLVLDLDPPEAPNQAGEGFRHAVAAARLVRQALIDAGLTGAVKTSGAKGVHVFVPVDAKFPIFDVAAATRAIAARAERLDPALATTAYIREDRGGKVFLDSTRSGGATVVAAYSPRIRPGTPVSFPLSWDELDDVVPAQFTLRTAPDLLGARDPWVESMPEPQTLPDDLVEEGRTIPVARLLGLQYGRERKKRERRGGDLRPE
jgi:bifunctional non-homologous end joining protein LigD